MLSETERVQFFSEFVMMTLEKITFGRKLIMLMLAQFWYHGITRLTRQIPKKRPTGSSDRDWENVSQEEVQK